ncbi:hypothetical protein GOBAR_DD07733 [Gossypium barbadense]|nr:hypothetical protein GOBAR_DD07733 [Gossypium barbadense]
MRAAMPPINTKNMSTPLEEEESELRRGPWTLEEDTLLTHYIARHGEGRWNMLAKCAGLKRTGKSCRLRWLNYLKPDIKRGNLTPQEQLLILELHSKWGNRWSKIAQHLPGRTDNEIKNYWRTRVQKQARQLNIESNSQRFLDAVRCFWMPRLVQKVEQASPSSSSSSSSSSSYLKEMCTQSSVPSQLSSCCTVPSFPTFSPLANKTTDISNSSSNVYGHTTLDQCYNIDSNDYGMEGISFASMSGVGFYEGTPSEGNWMCNEMSDDLWNMDDIWQLRSI